MLRRPIAVFVFAAGLSLSAGILPAAASPADARSFVDTAVREAVASLQVHGLTHAHVIDRFRAFLRKDLDMPMLAHTTLGRYWARATPEQLTEFQSLFENYLVASYGDSLVGISPDTLKVGAATAIDATTTDVHIDLVSPGEPPQPVDVVVGQSEDGSYRIRDINAQGVSLAKTLAADFTGAIKQHGDKIDGLLTLLRQKTESLNKG